MCAERKQVLFTDEPESIMKESIFTEQRDYTENVPSLYERLMECLCCDDVERVKVLLESDLKDCKNFTLLHFAAKAGAYHVLKFCLENMTQDVDCRDSTSEENTALFWAIKEGHQEVVNLLLDYKASPVSLNIFEDDAVYVAVNYGRRDILADLLARGLDANGPLRSKDAMLNTSTSINGLSSLNRAISLNDEVMLKQLIQAGADVYNKNNEICSISSGLIPLSHRLEKKDLFRGTSIHLAVMLCPTSNVVQILLDTGFNLNDKSENVQSPLLLAARLWHQQVLKLMIPYCTDMEVLQQVMWYASQHGQVSVIESLLEHSRLDVNASCSPRPSSQTGFPLTVAVNSGHPDVVRYLLNKGASPLKCSIFRIARLLPVESLNVKNCLRHSEIHRKSGEILDLILEATGGIDIDRMCLETGSTAFFICCTKGNICMALRLMQAGADIHRANSAAISPLHYLIRDVIKPYNSHRSMMNCLIIMLLLFIVNFHPEFPWLQNFMNSDKFSLLPHVIQTLVSNRLTKPSSLMELARAAIYKAIGKNIHLKLSHLGLPISLKPFVLLDDLMKAQIELFDFHNYHVLSEMNCVCNPKYYLSVHS